MSLNLGQEKVIILLKNNTDRPKVEKCPIFALYCVATQCAQQYYVDFRVFILTFRETICIFIFMVTTIDPYRYFAHPESSGQRQYEALRAFYVEKLPAKVVAGDWR